MKKTHGYSVDIDEKTEILFRHGELLGEGNNGLVYRLPGNLLIKIFYEEKICKDESSILLKVKDSKYFPKIKKFGDKYIIREMVYGEQLDKYIKKNGLSRRITNNIYEMLEEFKRLGFTKIDTRCRDIYVINDNEDLKLIDPKGCYKRKVKFPRHLMKGLKSLGCLDEFLDYIEEIDKNQKKQWEDGLEKYFKEKKEKLTKK
ncbi:MAG: protein kinase [Clostridium sp.]